MKITLDSEEITVILIEALLIKTDFKHVITPDDVYFDVCDSQGKEILDGTLEFVVDID